MQYCASISYGKDSLAMLHVIVDILHKPLDRIITAEVWATDTIQADLPPMVEFKEKADRIIKDRWGIEVEHFYATDKDGNKLTYEKMFYHIPKRRTPKKEGGGGKPGKKHGTIMGWPFQRGPWCNSGLKMAALQRMAYAKGAVVQQAEGAICKKIGSPDGGAVKNAVVDYIGIAADEPIRIERHQGKPGKEMPLVEAGWTEQMCRKWCEENGLLSPLYATANRGGCWFCHNQPVDQLRQLRRDYPELWALMLKWDSDSPVFFHSDGQTVHDFDQRFQMEDDGFFKGEKFRWDSLNAAQMNIDQFL